MAYRVLSKNQQLTISLNAAVQGKPFDGRHMPRHNAPNPPVQGWYLTKTVFDLL